MTMNEIEQAFSQRLPVLARVNGIVAEECILKFSCIHAIRRRWDERLGREAVEVELLDRNRRCITTAGINDVFFDEEHTTQEGAFDVCRRAYEKYLGLLTPNISESIDFYLREGMEPELIVRVIEIAHEEGKHSWSYVSAILMDKLKKNIKTVDAFVKEQQNWREKARRKANQLKVNKFVNYVDTNKPDYANFAEQILADMLEE